MKIDGLKAGCNVRLLRSGRGGDMRAELPVETVWTGRCECAVADSACGMSWANRRAADSDVDVECWVSEIASQSMRLREWCWRERKRERRRSCLAD